MFIVIMKIHSRRAYRPISDARNSYHSSNSTWNWAWSETWEYFRQSFEMWDLKRNSIDKAFMMYVMGGRGRARWDEIRFNFRRKVYRQFRSWSQEKRKLFLRFSSCLIFNMTKTKWKQRKTEEMKRRLIKDICVPLAPRCYGSNERHSSIQQVKQIDSLIKVLLALPIMPKLFIVARSDIEIQ